jgi:hypothetical protein
MRVKYFHFREWADASAVFRKKRKPNSKFGKNPYKDWDQDKLDKFLFDLAKVVASDNKLIVGGYVPQNMLLQDQANGTVKTQASAEELCVRHFFDSVVSTISEVRPVIKRQGISVFFDHSTNNDWKNIVHNGYELSCKKHSQYKAISFVSRGLRERVESGDAEFLPLQAADMVAYRIRQQMEKLVTLDLSGPEWKKLDSILFASMNKRESKLTDVEKDAMLRRVFLVPKNTTYEQAMDSIWVSSRK